MKRPRRTHRRDERGVALAVAIGVSFVVILLSTSAIEGSVNSITQSAVSGKQVDSTDAAEAGIQWAINQVTHQVVVGGTSFACPASTTLLSGNNFATTYTLSYGVVVGQSAPTSVTACTGATIPVTAGDTYLFQATGKTSAGVIGAKTEQAQVYVPSTKTSAASSSFSQALFAGSSILGTGGFSLTGGDSYAGTISACLSSDSFGGNYYSSGGALSLIAGISLPLPSTFTGACSVSGNLYMNNSAAVTITGGSGVGKSFYGNGVVTMAGGADVGGDLWANGLVTLNAGSVVGGSVYTTGGLTMIGGPVVKGSVYSNGAVTVNGTVTGNIYANGPVTVGSGASVGGTIFATGSVSVAPGATVHAIQSSSGITYVYPTSTGSGYAPLIVPTCGTLFVVTATSCTYGSPTLPAAQFGSTGTIATIATSINAQMVIAANNVSGTTTGTAPSVAFPIYNYDSTAWPSNIGFCSATLTCANTTPGLRTLSIMGTAANGYCNLTTTTINGQVVLTPGTVWAAVASMESPTLTVGTVTTATPPTIINTNCQFSWGDSYLKGYSIPLYNSLAIFDSAGFTLPSSFSGFSSAGSSGKHQLYLVVPASNVAPGPTLVPPVAGYGANYLPALQSLLDPNLFPIGEATCNLLTGPDIVISQPLTDSSDNISDFLYTPSNICNLTGNATIYGQAYAGGSVASTSNWNQTYASITPFVTNVAAGGGGVAGTPVVQSVQQVANPTGVS